MSGVKCPALLLCHWFKKEGECVWCVCEGAIIWLSRVMACCLYGSGRGQKRLSFRETAHSGNGAEHFPWLIKDCFVDFAHSNTFLDAF